MEDFKNGYYKQEWKERSLEIQKRDCFTCQICGAKDVPLSVHHKRYEKDRQLWDYDDEYLITLCWDCHELVGEYDLKFKRFPVNVSNDEYHLIKGYVTILYDLSGLDESQLFEVYSYIKELKNGKRSGVPLIPTGLSGWDDDDDT
jgi:hypothetical protein